MKVMIFGTGNYYKQCRENLLQVQGYEINAFADNNQEKWGGIIDGKRIVSPSELTTMQYDKIIIASSAYQEIAAQLLKQGIDQNMISIASTSVGLQFCKYDIHLDVQSDEFTYTVNREGYETVCFSCSGQSKTDIDIVNEFYTGIYNYNFPHSKSIVIDIGMNIGIPTINFAAHPNVEKVYSFEPFEGTYKQAVRNIEGNASKIKNKIQTFNYALLNYDGKLDCTYIPQATGWGSIINTQDSWGQKTCRTEVLVKDAATEIERILKENPGAPVIIKVDCEGSEHKIFDTMKKHKIFEQVSCIMMEWHYDYRDIEMALKEKGFHVFMTFLGVCPVKTGMLYAIK